MQTETLPNTLLDAIRIGIEPTATTEQKHAGAAACRALLAALDAKPGAPLAPPRPPNPFAQLAALQPEQLIDLIVSKLQTFKASPTDGEG